MRPYNFIKRVNSVWRIGHVCTIVYGLRTHFALVHWLSNAQRDDTWQWSFLVLVRLVLHKYHRICICVCFKPKLQMTPTDRYAISLCKFSCKSYIKDTVSQCPADGKVTRPRTNTSQRIWPWHFINHIKFSVYIGRWKCLFAYEYADIHFMNPFIFLIWIDIQTLWINDNQQVLSGPHFSGWFEFIANEMQTR